MTGSLKKGALFCSLLGTITATALGAPDSLPPFDQLYKALRSNLSGLAPEELDRAATRGLLNELQSRVTLITNSAGASSNRVQEIPLVTKVSVFDTAFGYVRIGRVDRELARDLRQEFNELTKTNKLKGLVLDLRYATGFDYAAAASAADLFLDTDQPMLRWAESSIRSTPKADAIKLPLVLLVNQQTTGAAEALAAALRDLRAGLLIGSATAGQASLYKEITLEGGQRLRVASSPIHVGNGRPLPADGLKPDIAVALSPEDEKAYFEDAYRVLPKPLAQSDQSSTSAFLSGTNRASRRRINEAELVRIQREGSPIDSETGSRFFRDESSRAFPTDPALVRALDLLKGLTVVQQKRAA